MTGIEELNPERLANVSLLLADIDDTVSTRGKLTAPAFAALWRLHEAGIRVGIVTGRPAGWCDHIARFWPVDAVIGENGAFYFFHDGTKLGSGSFIPPGSDGGSASGSRRCRKRSWPKCPARRWPPINPTGSRTWRLTSAKTSRRWTAPAVLRIKAIFEEAGAHAKISSIHVNGWFGEFDKLSTARRWASERLDTDLDAERESCVYCGDSPNDEPMFQFFPLSFGMANVKPFLPLMAHPPAFLCDLECGAGFCQVAERILDGPTQIAHAMNRSLRRKFYFVQALTLVRVPLIFVFLAVSVFCGHPLPEFWFIVAFAAMILSAVTDLFDGYFARKFQVTSRLGSYADPMTDKVFYLTTFPDAGVSGDPGGPIRATRACCWCWRFSSCCATSGSRSSGRWGRCTT